MTKHAQIPFITLIIMISFASVNAVLFTPALPNIASFFAVSDGAVQQTITWFLVGYTLGQLVYSPLANRFGRKQALYAGIWLQIFSSFLCVGAAIAHQFWLLFLGRVLVALGAGVGLKMAFTLVNECYEPAIASQKTSYLMMAFAITPGLGVAIGGFLNARFGWASCFYAGAIYGGVLLFLVYRMPETKKNLDVNALKMNQLVTGYLTQFKNTQLVLGGLLMGAGTSVIYIFAAVAPFVAMRTFGMTSEQYGLANLLPPTGLLLGSLCSASLAKRHHLTHLIFAGILIVLVGVLLMLAMVFMHFCPILSLFLPATIIYFGLCFIFSNASSLAMSRATDKAHGSAVMSFVNMGLATIMVLNLGYVPVNTFVLPVAYFALCVVMVLAYGRVLKKNRLEAKKI
jgi:DHA1 family bicyclomycin/chloramphenicol resistance-like MFS transporter